MAKRGKCPVCRRTGIAVHSDGRLYNHNNRPTDGEPCAGSRRPPAGGAPRSKRRAAAPAAPPPPAPEHVNAETLLRELGRTLELLKGLRSRIEAAVEEHRKQTEGSAEAYHLPRDITTALKELVGMQGDLSKEYRQLQKAIDAQPIAPAKAREILIAAGWTPPPEDS